MQINPQGQPVLSQITGFEAAAYQYDARGRLALITEGSGADARTTTLAFHPAGSPQAGYLASITDAEERITRFEYDALGRVKKQILPDLREILYSYDANGNLASLTPPGRPAHGFDYDGDYATKERLLQENISANPDSPHVYGNYATFLMTQDRYQEALDYWQKALDKGGYPRASSKSKRGERCWQNRARGRRSIYQAPHVADQLSDKKILSRALGAPFRADILFEQTRIGCIDYTIEESLYSGFRVGLIRDSAGMPRPECNFRII